MISVAADIVGMHLNAYLRIEGLVRPGRTPGGTRLYSEHDLERLRDIQRLTTELGLNLAGVRRVLALEDELAALRQRLDRLEREMSGADQSVRKQYRRDIVVYSEAQREYRLPRSGAEMDFNRLTIKSREAVAAAVEDARRSNPRSIPSIFCWRCSTRSCRARSSVGAVMPGPEAEARLARSRPWRALAQQPPVDPGVERARQGGLEAQQLDNSTSPSSTSHSRSRPVPRDELLAPRSRKYAGAQRVTSQDTRARTRRWRSSAGTRPRSPRPASSTPLSAGTRRSARRWVLSRRTTAVLIGDPGVGKTAIVEGLAQQVVASGEPRAEGQACLGARHRRPPRRREVPR